MNRSFFLFPFSSSNLEKQEKENAPRYAIQCSPNLNSQTTNWGHETFSFFALCFLLFSLLFLSPFFSMFVFVLCLFALVFMFSLLILFLLVFSCLKKSFFGPVLLCWAWFVCQPPTPTTHRQLPTTTTRRGREQSPAETPTENPAERPSKEAETRLQRANE